MSDPEAFDVPQRSDAQRMAALKRANHVRERRAKLKRNLKKGRVPFEDILMDPPEFVLSMKILDLLVAIPRVGRKTADLKLRKAGVSPSKAIGGMTPRQRDDLVRLLR